MTVDDFFYENRLFPYLDYAITGRSLHAVVYVEVDLYTEDAKKLAPKLPNLKIMLDERILDVAILQLGSELQRAFGMAGQGNAVKKMLAEELHVLDAQSWKNIDDVAVIDPRKMKLVPGSFYDLNDKKENLTKKVDISYIVDDSFAKDHKELLPLYISITKLMSANTTASLWRQFGFCPDSVSYSPENHTTKTVQTFRMVESLKVDLEDVRQVVSEALSDLYQEKAFSRLISALSRAASSKPDCLFPDPYTLYKQTDIIIGAKGWKQIATKENCKIILTAMEVTVTVDDIQSSLDVATIPSKD